MYIPNLLRRARGLFKEELPTDGEALERYIQDLLSIYSLPNKPDYHHAVATAIQHLTQGEHRAPKYHIYSFVKRAGAMRAAYQKLQKLKEEEKQAATPKPESPPEPKLEEPRVQSTST